MADTVFVFVERLANLLIEEAASLSGVEDEVKWLKNELEWMMSFLKDADAKQEQEERVKRWVTEIREAAYDAEDIIDTYISKIASNKKKGIMGYITKLRGLDKGMILHEINNKITALKKKIEEIPQKRVTYGIENMGLTRGSEQGTSSFNERLWQVRRPCPYPAVGEFVIGRTREVDALVAELMKERKQRSVVSVVGMGGIGKTTLARNIYNHNFSNHFTRLAWVTVSKEHRTREILQGILKNISHLDKNETEQMEVIELERRVYDLLERERYLVVLDDLWTINAWESLQNAFPDAGNQSRILITTRIKDVALRANTQTSPYEIGFLTEEESWKLFCRKAFPENNTPSCPRNLEDLGRAMVKKCGGLPLALLLLGGMLSKNNKSPEDWDKVLNNIGWHLTKSQDGTIISAILGLSYIDLPYYLKSCFKYLSLFPEDEEINMTKLIQYWTAEGIIPQEGQETLEGVAKKYVNDLIDRSLLQVVKRTKRGRSKTCRVHDILRELAILKAKEENLLLEISDNKFYHDDALAKSSRRCTVHSVSHFSLYYDHVKSLQLPPSSHMRTLIFFTNVIDDALSKDKMKFICGSFKLLRVLDLKSLCVVYLPGAIGKLVHLRYLSFDVSLLDGKFTESMGKLQNLQHLHILNTYGTVKTIPDVIHKMERLRHLSIGKNLISQDLRIDTYKNLHTLKGIHATAWIKGGNGDWVNFTNLEDLQIESVSNSHEGVLLNSFSGLTRLRSLWLHTVDDNDTFPTLTPLAHCTQLLKLHLKGRLLNLAGPFGFPPNLIKLTLYDSRLNLESIGALGQLPNLRLLLLFRNSYIGKALSFRAYEFPQLQFLEFEELYELEKLTMEEGALKMLWHLRLYDCCKLSMIPEGLSFMTNHLKELVISRMPIEFDYKLRGEDLHKFKDIPSIKIDGTDFGRGLSYDTNEIMGC